MVFKIFKYNIFFIICFVLLFTGMFFAHDVEAAACDRNSDNEITISSNVASEEECEFPPNTYRITFYKGGLCTADPMGTATGSADLSSCFLFFDNDSGKAVSLVSSATGVLTPSTLIEGGLSLEINTYPYAFLILDNALEMQHTDTFSATMTGSSATGTSCWSLKKTSTNSNTTNAGTRNGVAAAAINEGTRSTYTIDCGSSEDVPSPVPFTTDVIDTLGDDCSSNFAAIFGTTGWDTAEEAGSAATLGGIMGAKLLQSDDTIATDCTNSSKIFYGIDFTNSLDINENTSSFDLSFKVKTGVSMAISEQSSAPHYTNLAANPFQVIFTAE